MKINGQTITAKRFAWDRCHKIYLVNTEKEKKKYIKYGYDLFPINELRGAYRSSCSLKFIYNGDLTKVVGQFEEAVFED